MHDETVGAVGLIVVLPVALFARGGGKAGRRADAVVRRGGRHAFVRTIQPQPDRHRGKGRIATRGGLAGLIMRCKLATRQNDPGKVKHCAFGPRCGEIGLPRQQIGAKGCVARTQAGALRQGARRCPLHSLQLDKVGGQRVIGRKGRHCKRGQSRKPKISGAVHFNRRKDGHNRRQAQDFAVKARHMFQHPCIGQLRTNSTPVARGRGGAGRNLYTRLAAKCPKQQSNAGAHGIKRHGVCGIALNRGKALGHPVPQVAHGFLGFHQIDRVQGHGGYP